MCILVYWADIIQAPTRDKVTRGSVRTCHHPGGAQGDGVDLNNIVLLVLRVSELHCDILNKLHGDEHHHCRRKKKEIQIFQISVKFVTMVTDLVCWITIPHNQFSVLWGRDQVSWVRAPVHGVHLQPVVVHDLLVHGVVHTLDKCPLNVLLVLICILPMGSMLPVAWARLVSQAAFLPSLMAFLRCSASCRSCSSSFMVP